MYLFREAAERHEVEPIGVGVLLPGFTLALTTYAGQTTCLTLADYCQPLKMIFLGNF